jgi:uncharacterized membrane protein YedE/YeeE
MNAATRLPYLATAAVSGLLFGAGLYISQMVDPYKVLRFLDFTLIPEGLWDPSVAFVMAAGLAVMFIAVRLSRSRTAPLFDTSFHEPEFKKVDAPLVLGSAIFGVGWGMSGICPGPGVALVAFWPDHILIFLVAMFAGSYAGSLVIPSGRSRRLAVAR